MLVTRHSIAWTSSRKARVEALVEAHSSCCPDGSCAAPNYSRYQRRAVTIPAGLDYPESMRLVQMALSRATENALPLSRAAELGREPSGDDAVLARRYEDVARGPSLL